VVSQRETLRMILLRISASESKALLGLFLAFPPYALIGCFK
jgi:hypothetical protein